MAHDRLGCDGAIEDDHAYGDRGPRVVVAEAEDLAARVANFDTVARRQIGRLSARDRLRKDPRITAAHRTVTPGLERYAPAQLHGA